MSANKVKDALLVCGVAAAQVALPSTAHGLSIVSWPYYHSAYASAGEGCDCLTAGGKSLSIHKYTMAEKQVLTTHDAPSCDPYDVVMLDVEDGDKQIELYENGWLYANDDAYDNRSAYEGGTCPGKKFGWYGSVTYSAIGDGYEGMRCDIVLC
jgi:hypothetical protein